MHITSLNVCESDLKERIKHALLGDEHFKYVSGCLEQEPKRPIGKWH